MLPEGREEEKEDGDFAGVEDNASLLLYEALGSETFLTLQYIDTCFTAAPPPQALTFEFYSQLECSGDPCINNCGDVIHDDVSCRDIILNDPTVGNVAELQCASMVLTNETTGVKTFTRRCICPVSWNLDGPNCDTVRPDGHGGGFLANITFTILGLFSLFIGVSTWYAVLQATAQPRCPPRGRRRNGTLPTLQRCCCRQGR